MSLLIVQYLGLAENVRELIRLRIKCGDSPYNYAFDNPVRFIDPDGMIAMSSDANSQLWSGGGELYDAFIENLNIPPCFCGNSDGQKKAKSNEFNPGNTYIFDEVFVRAKPEKPSYELSQFSQWFKANKGKLLGQ